jgi:hypothetical protein
VKIAYVSGLECLGSIILSNSKATEIEFELGITQDKNTSTSPNPFDLMEAWSSAESGVNIGDP